MDTVNFPIDREKLLEIMDEDEDLMKECLTDFVNEYPGMLHKIKSAIDNEQCNDLEREAHAFKGSLTYLAAREASSAAQQLEDMGRNRDLKNVHRVFSTLKSECEKISAYISSC